MDNPENKSCFDCGTLFPNFVSINNAVFICQKCSNLHRGFGEFSIVKSPSMDNWSEAEIKLLSLGGNQRLKYFLLDYSLPQNTDPNYKYFIYALDYYRRQLQFELAGAEKSTLKKPVKPDSLIGLESLRQSVPVSETMNNVNNQPRNPSSNQQRNTNTQPQQRPQQQKGFFDDVNDFFNEAGGEMSKVFNQMGQDIKQAKLDEKFESFGKQTGEFFTGAFEDTKKFFNGEPTNENRREEQKEVYVEPVVIDRTKKKKEEDDIIIESGNFK